MKERMILCETMKFMTVLLNIKTPLLPERNSQDKVLDECSWEISPCAYLILTFFPRHSYCHRTTYSLWEVEWDLRSSRLTTLSRQGQLQLVSQDCVQLCFEYLQGWTHHDLSGQPVPVTILTVKVFLTFRGNFMCFNSCPLPLSCHWAPLRGIRLHHLLSLSYDNYTHW